MPEALEVARKKDHLIDAFLKRAKESDQETTAAPPPLTSAPAAAAERPAEEGGAPTEPPSQERGGTSGESVEAPAVASSLAPEPSAQRPDPRLKASLEALLFRPVQRMCLYPLLLKQALAAHKRVERWRKEEAADCVKPAEGVGVGTSHGEGADGPDSNSANASNAGAGGGGSEAPGSTSSHSDAQLSQALGTVFSTIQETLGNVNDKVRGVEARKHTIRVLTTEVQGGAALVTPDRVLRHECFVDMEPAAPTADQRAGGFCGCLRGGGGSSSRRQFKWYVFSDAILICRSMALSAHWVQVCASACACTWPRASART